MGTVRSLYDVDNYSCLTFEPPLNPQGFRAFAYFTLGVMKKHTQSKETIMSVGIVLGMAIALVVVSFVLSGLALKEYESQNAQIETLEMELAESEFIRRILLNKMTPDERRSVIEYYSDEIHPQRFNPAR